jgi:hypothetical protein
VPRTMAAPTIGAATPQPDPIIFHDADARRYVGVRQPVIPAHSIMYQRFWLHGACNTT